MSDIEKRIGGKITELRRNKQLTQIQLAEKADLTQESISRLERGVAFPSLKTMERVALALDVPLKEFFDFGSEPAKDQQFERELGKLVSFLRTLKRQEMLTLRRILQETFKILREKRK